LASDPLGVGVLGHQLAEDRLLEDLAFKPVALQHEFQRAAVLQQGLGVGQLGHRLAEALHLARHVLAACVAFLGGAALALQHGPGGRCGKPWKAHARLLLLRPLPVEP
jgi:hypothetical protein